MKKIYAVALLLSFIFLNSCGNSEKPETEELNFVVTGNVKKGEGRTLLLTIPSKYPNDQLFSKVVDGKFRFQGSIPSPERALLSIAGEDDFPTDIFLSEDSIILNLEIGEMMKQTLFVSDSILKSDLNRFFRESRKEFYENSSVWVFGDTVKRDSMRVNVYPETRKQVLNFYDEQFTKPEHSVVALHFLKTILEYRDHVFYTSDLSETEKQKLNSYFEKIDLSLKNTPEFKSVALYIEELNKPSWEQEFIDYTLVNEKGEEVKLSEVIAENRYTVLDFWWSGCVPCRRFNQEGKPQYAKLRENGIEIIGINTDTNRSLWKKASEKDGLEWIDLYSGAESTILADYRVRAYPTKIIFDNDGRRVDLEFKNVEELLKLGETAANMR